MGGVEGVRAALADRYDVEHEVGHGAMATVYLAHDLRFDRHVAIKVLSPDLSAALGPERFLREIDVVAKLNHPHILPLLDSGNAGGFLYYVMPFAEGSLRSRLVREMQLRIDEAIALTREIALALDYAHGEGIVHRDVKPENILLSRGYALLADFGIARVLSQVDVERLTQTGASPGTPSYMSPEQFGGGGTLDGRSDLYSLGCVLYELLAGAPPFTGPSAQAIAARHLTDPVPPLRTVRRTVSEELQRVVLRALEKVPADRFGTGAEFASALAAPEILLPVPSPWWRRLSRWKAAAAIAAVVLGSGVAVKTIPGLWTDGASGLDSTRYAILPVERDSGLVSFNEDQLLQDAILKWSGISVVDRSRLLEALPRSRARLTSTDAQAVAKRVGAGRYIVSQVSRLGDSLRVHSAVYATAARGPPIYESSAKIGLDRAQTVPAFSRIADRLLFGGSGQGAGLDQPLGTTSRPARQAFELGLDSVYSWNLPAADSGFNMATSFDPRFHQAFLWLAQVRAWMSNQRSWSEANTATWQSAAERAAAGRSTLSIQNKLVSDALVSLGRGDPVRACGAWTRLTSSNAYDFASWYSLANCLSRDDAVLRDPTSPSGWRFRTSYEQAARAYVHALQLLPSIHRSLRTGLFESVRRLLMTNLSLRRPGRALPPDTTTFAAAPSWQGDTLAFVPYRADERFGRSRQLSATAALAVRHQQQLFRNIATAWVTAYPRSADAVEALAVSLDMLGDPAALDTIRYARALAVTSDEHLRVAVAQIWMMIKFSTPANSAGMRAARALADSVLRQFAPSTAVEPLLAASVAALTGRASLAVEYTRDRRVTSEWSIPPSIAGVAFPLVVYGAMGGPRDSLVVLESRFDSLSATVASSPLEEARWTWLARAATLAFPEHRMRALTSLSEASGSGDYLLNAEAAFVRGDTLKARMLFHQLQSLRRYTPPTQITIDALYPESWLLAALGEERGAIRWLDPFLNAIRATPPQAFADPVRAGSLVRAMALRAQLADRVGDRQTAQRWAQAVVTLWSDADPFLQPVVRQLRFVAR